MFLDKSTKKEIVIDSSDTYFDQRSNYIYIRDVAESKFDYVYNMKEEKLLKFTRY